jgi:cytochrome c556
MSQPMPPPPGRSPYAFTGVAAVATVIAVLLVVFAVSRMTRPVEEAVVTAQAPSASPPAAASEAPPAVVRNVTPPPAVAGAPAAPGSGAATAGGTAGGDPSLTGSSKPDDVILARQLLMDGNETAMMPIDRAAGGADIPLAALKAGAYAIYSYLSVAPHLFPSTTKPVVAKDGSPPSTAATEAIWADFGGFYQAATDAANVAYEASQAADIAKFRELAMQLRMACDACHAKYMHVFDPTTGK